MNDQAPREVVDLRSRYEWKKVEAPKTWRPKANGEELVGFAGTQGAGRVSAYDFAISKYGDGSCPRCGQEYAYDEGHSIVLSGEQLSVLRVSD